MQTHGMDFVRKPPPFHGQVVQFELLIRETPPVYGQTEHFESTFYSNKVYSGEPDSLTAQKTKHQCGLAEVSEAEQWRQIHILHRSQTVRKVLARLKYSVPIYKARSGFSILTEEYLTFQTVSPSVNLPYIRITSKAASVKLFNIMANKDGGAHYENNFQDKRMEEMLRRWYH